MQITEAEVWTFLRGVEQGDILLRPFVDPQQIYGGVVPYRASNGWECAVFNDCNVWDYLDELRAPDGRQIDFDDLSADLEAYRPPADVSWQRYRIPGVQALWCACCGVDPVRPVTRHMPLLCQECRAIRSAKLPAKTAPDAPFPYVVMCDLPPEQLTTLFPWLQGQACAVVDSEGLGARSCVYYHDYACWYQEWNP